MPRFDKELLGKGGNAYVRKCYVLTPDGSELLFACKIEVKVLLSAVMQCYKFVVYVM